MVHIFEKKPIAYSNEYGIEEITNQDVFKNGPCVIVILAQAWFLSSVNGAMRLVSNFVNPDIDDFYDSNKRIMGLGFGDIGIGAFFGECGEFSETTPTDDELEEFVNTYFVPLVSSNHKKMDMITAMKNIRNINFVTYCDGSKIFKRMEELFNNKMKEIGYSNEEIKQILSQICLAAVSGSSLETKATTILFGDKNDRSCNFKSQLAESDDSFINHDNYYEFVIDGDGDHDFRKYMKKDEKLSSAIKMFLNKALEDSCGPIVSEPFLMDIIDKYHKKQQSIIEYETFMIKKPISNYLIKLYYNYKKSDDRIDIKDLMEKLQLSLYDENNIDSSDVLLEVAHKGDEVIAFCSHGENYLYPYAISHMVCSPSYRNKGIATNMFNNALLHMNQRGVNSFIVESSKKRGDNNDFWISKGAIQVRTRWLEDFGDAIEISVLQFPDIKQYLDSIESGTGEKILKRI